MKPGRNEPCSCGSGLKFKKCCGAAGSPLASEQQAAVTAAMAQAVECHQNGRLEEAAAGYRQVLATVPGHGDAIHLLGVVEYQLGNYMAAIDLIQKAIPLLPGFAETYINLGTVYKDSGRLTDAVTCFQKALAIQPAHPVAHMNLGNVFLDLMKFDKAFDSYRRALSISPDYSVAHSNLLLLLLYDPQQTPASLVASHQEWDRRHGRPPQRYTQYENDRDSQRPLRVGYLSPDFARHPVGYFLLPVLPAHDRRNVTVFCYSNRMQEDEISDRLRSAADTWRSIASQNDRDLAKQIRADRIDILVDLSGHTANNRMPLFALHPAPVQVSWLGYPHSTGLSTIRYRLTDVIADPPDEVGLATSETLVRLPHGFHCYAPPEQAPEVAPSPTLKNGFITFGSFNNQVKQNNEVMSLWAEILRTLPNSRLILKNRIFDDPASRRCVTSLLTKEGIGKERFELRGQTPSHYDHLQAYNEIDIALDPFPYNGTTTTFDALWMGVPVVTLAGARHASRVGASILHHLGLDYWVARSLAEYRTCALELAGDPQSLAGFRQTLREKLHNSQLCDAAMFAASLETAYREMWTQWCSEH